MEKSFILKGDICYSVSPEELVTVPSGYLVCTDSRVGGVFDRLPEKYKELPVKDMAHQLIVPGLTDLHLHAPQYAFRGIGADLELLDWLNIHTFPEEEKYADLDYAKRAYAIFAEDMKKSPTTRACIFATVHVPATEYLMEQMESTGLRCYVGKVNMDRNAPDALCEGGSEASAQATVTWLKDTVGRFEHIWPMLTPRFIPSCSNDLMEQLSEIQKTWNLPVQSHLSENQGEVDWVGELMPAAQFYGDAYDRYGLFGGDVPTIMAHCVWSDEAEIQRMKSKGVYIAHCPQSNVNLASGIAPVRRYLKEGMHVGLGSDMAGGYHLSIFRAMADAVAVSKLRWCLVDRTLKPLTVKEAFYLGTKGGGNFFGNVGSFEEGYAFDAVVMDDRGLKTAGELSLQERLSRMVCLSDQCVMTAKYADGCKVY